MSKTLSRNSPNRLRDQESPAHTVSGRVDERGLQPAARPERQTSPGVER